MMKNAFYFIMLLKIFEFFYWNFGHVGKRLDQKTKVNFTNYNVTVWQTNNYDTRIAHYLKKYRQSVNEI